MYSTSFSVKDVIPVRANFCLTILTYEQIRLDSLNIAVWPTYIFNFFLGSGLVITWRGVEASENAGCLFWL